MKVNARKKNLYFSDKMQFINLKKVPRIEIEAVKLFIESGCQHWIEADGECYAAISQPGVPLIQIDKFDPKYDREIGSLIDKIPELLYFSGLERIFPHTQRKEISIDYDTDVEIDLSTHSITMLNVYVQGTFWGEDFRKFENFKVPQKNIQEIHVIGLLKKYGTESELLNKTIFPSLSNVVWETPEEIYSSLDIFLEPTSDN